MSSVGDGAISWDLYHFSLPVCCGRTGPISPFVCELLWSLDVVATARSCGILPSRRLLEADEGQLMVERTKKGGPPFLSRLP